MGARPLPPPKKTFRRFSPENGLQLITCFRRRCFDNSTCKRVLDLLEPGDLRLEQVVIKTVAVVKLFWNRNINGYSEADEYGNSRIWRQMRSG